MPLNVLISGENFPILYGLQALVRLVLGNDTIIEIVRSAPEILKKLRESQHQILISEIIIKGLDGFTIITKALSINPNLKILIVNFSPSTIIANKCIKAGALGYINTSENEEEFRNAIRKVYMGKVYLPKDLDEKENTSAHSPTTLNDNPFDQLSNREFTVLMLLMNGKGTKEISTQLNLKLSTTSTFKKRIFKKLNVNNIIDLVKLVRHFKI